VPPAVMATTWCELYQRGRRQPPKFRNVQHFRLADRRDNTQSTIPQSLTNGQAVWRPSVPCNKLSILQLCWRAGPPLNHHSTHINALISSEGEHSLSSLTQLTCRHRRVHCLNMGRTQQGLPLVGLDTHSIDVDVRNCQLTIHRPTCGKSSRGTRTPRP
jgi:hypothetical protein